MYIGKKTALLAAAVGALVLGGAGDAGAVGPGFGYDGGGSQSNECSTSSVLGPVEVATPLTVVGPVTHETTCANYSESGVSKQKNDCETSSVIGPVVVNLSMTPAAPIKNGTTCVNYSESGASKQENDCETSSVTGPVTVSPLAPGPKIDTAAKCVNIAGGDEH